MANTSLRFTAMALVDSPIRLSGADLQWGFRRLLISAPEAVRYATIAAREDWPGLDPTLSELSQILSEDSSAAELVLVNAPKATEESRDKWCWLYMSALRNLIDLDSEAGWLAAEEACSDFDYPPWLTDSFGYRKKRIFTGRSRPLSERLDEALRLEVRRLT